MYSQRLPYDRVAALIEHCRAQGIGVARTATGYEIETIGTSLRPERPDFSQCMWTAEGPESRFDEFSLLLCEASDALDGDYEP